VPIRPQALPLVVLCALAPAGCGSAPATELPPAATLPAAPTPSATPAGRVVPESRTFPDPARATTAGRTFVADRRAGVLRVVEGGREIERLRTGLAPAAVTVAGQGRQVAVVSVRGRILDLYDARTLRRIGRADAGSGPVQVASDGGNYLYVTDAIGGSVLVFHTVPELTLVRRYPMRGSPWAIVHDPQRRRLWVTLAAANRLAELTTGRRIRRLEDYAAVAQPSAVAVDARGVAVRGRDGIQLFEP
jgi:DNA-binding beta-propeller fold protein YncE